MSPQGPQASKTPLISFPPDFPRNPALNIPGSKLLVFITQRDRLHQYKPTVDGAIEVRLGKYYREAPKQESIGTADLYTTPLPKRE